MNKYSEPELEQIIKGCARNNRNSQNELYKLYYSYAMSVSIRYVKNETDAITVTNDSFLKVFRYIKKYNTHQPFKPWFRKILVNTALTHIQKQSKIKMVENLLFRAACNSSFAQARFTKYISYYSEFAIIK